MILKFNHKPGHLFGILIGLLAIMACANQGGKEAYYTYEDFFTMPKIDAHMHYNNRDAELMEFADSVNFKLITINTYSTNNNQLDNALAIKQQFPGKFAFFGTLDTQNWNEPDFVETSIERINKVMALGACGIKIWKNVGMEIQDSTGRYIMIDDPVFEPVIAYLAKNNIRLMAHLGEPKNCWLPLEEMTVKGNRVYYERNPQYHMYLHPEAPSHEDHIAAMENLLLQHPQLEYIGAHLASLEYSIEELAKRLDRFPDMKVDMSGRVNHLMYQSLTKHEEVRNFVIKYQERLMYGSDRGVRPDTLGYSKPKKEILEKWTEEWVFFATDSIFNSPLLEDKVVKCLNLPKTVIDKIFYDNASYLFDEI